MTSVSIADLARLQDLSGCIPSEVSGPGWTRADRNGFTTAMVLRELRDLADGTAVDAVRSGALDFIERCRSPGAPSAFGFWPPDLRPDWAPHLPPDVDDTAIMAVELLRHGRLSRREGLRIVCAVLVPQRVEAYGCDVRPSWVVPGAFRTWIGTPERPNLVDCCVNANAVALMAMVGGTHLPGFQEAVATIGQGIAWAGSNPVRQRALTPFYPSARALEEAIDHAVECGATPLLPALHQLRRSSGDDDPEDRPAYCSDAYGRTQWRCRGLDLARALRRARRARRDESGPNDGGLLERMAACPT